MRHQEHIYIQNSNSALRNKCENNVNMSSDICVFQRPIFDIGGATKIPCAVSPSLPVSGNTFFCPSGYILSPDNTECQQTLFANPTLNGTPYTAAKTATPYGQHSTRFYDDLGTLSLPLSNSGPNIIDSTGGTVNFQADVTSPFWGNNTPYSGRLFSVGIWPTVVANNQWVGLSTCIDILESGTYYIGLAADNLCQLKVNGENIIKFSGSSIYNFYLWHVFPITLNAGPNILEIEGYNNSGLAVLAAEIYHPTSLSALTASTSTGTTGLIFSTLNYAGKQMLVGDTNGYSCPSGYALNLCGPTPTCVKLNTVPPTIYYYFLGTYVVTATTETIPFRFNFTANTESFSDTNANFKFEVYKYDQTSQKFAQQPTYQSGIIPYSGFSGLNSTTQFIPISGLSLDGEYLIKGYYEFDVCTDYLNRLGKKVDTLSYKTGTEYGLYDENQDYYFTAIWEAEKPSFMNSASNTPPAGRLFQQVITPAAGIKTFSVSNSAFGNIIVTLNGLVLAQDYDYSLSGSIVTLSAETVSDDIITIIYTTNGGPNFNSENISVDLPVSSGATNNQGSNLVYFNTTTGKYEVYTQAPPQESGSVVIMINGVTLANNVDYYQSSSNPKRFILEGDIMVGDVITIVYFPQISVINALITNNPVIVWSISRAPQLNNGQFTLEVSTGTSFTTLYTSETVDYVPNQLIYSVNFNVSGPIGTKFYYRVKNEKNYITICGDIINSTAYSDVIPIVVTTNAVNSY